MVLLIAPGPIGTAFGAGREWIVTNLGWFFILGVTSWVAFLLWAALSRYGAIRLGGNDAKPAYDNISWFTMLFAGGIGTVLMFWGWRSLFPTFLTHPGRMLCLSRWKPPTMP
ncbi:hypothetical protein HORIV_35710 [Vreelandella olivaria]|uniref:Uncharacterized protein n=1 Tax=Vreelandella olivaria TaxID=390919 RepID=A0ABN5WXM8_9GAMM|nr:hypothetical protein HORIV_35710 [Halomonas olivaria]